MGKLEGEHQVTLEFVDLLDDDYIEKDQSRGIYFTKTRFLYKVLFLYSCLAYACYNKKKLGMIPYYSLVEELWDIHGELHLMQLLMELLWKPMYKPVTRDMILFIKVVILTRSQVTG